MKLKVDNLKHLSDHGLAVEFTDSRLRSLVEELARIQNGTRTLEAGRSKLTLTRRGAVTFTELFLSVGTRTLRHCHYFESETGLKFSVSAGENEPPKENAYLTCRAVILGEKMPRVFLPRHGDEQDKLRAWLKTWSPLILGESGLRAFALEERTKTALEKIRSAKNARDYTIERIARVENDSSPENVAQSFEFARKRCQSALDSFETDSARLREQLASVNEDFIPTPENRYAFGSPWQTDHETRGAYFPARGARWSHDVISPNYRATVSGDEITFSSGIKSPFAFSQLVAWLEGKSPAPETRYGPVEKIECARMVNGAAVPFVLLKCGCHKIDAAADVPSLAPLLAPTHAVTLTPGVAAIHFATHPAEFRERVRVEIRDALSRTEERRAQVLRDYAEKKARMEKELRDTPAYLATLRANLASEEQRVLEAEKAISDSPAPLGANLEQARIFSAAVFNSLNSIHFSS